MVNKCVAYGCKSGYKSDNRKDVTFHSFPKDPEVCSKWLRAIPRKDFQPSKHSRMCSLHFTDDDFVVERTDKQDRRRRKNAASHLVNRYLKKDAVPSVFPNAPSYLSSPAPTHRVSAAAATSSGRQQQEAERLETMIEQFNAEDSITSLNLHQLASKLVN
jgi:hypothetical protein